MKKVIYSLAILFLMSISSFAQSITLLPSNTNEIFTIKKNGIGFSHESVNGLVKVGTYVDNGAGWIQTHTNHPLVFTTNNSSPQMKILTNGNVGIGNNSPLNKLDVGVAPGFSGNELALGNGVQGMSFALTPSAAIWYTNTNFAMMPASGVGYLGIGTTNPIAPLHITSFSSVNTSGGYFFSATSSLANIPAGVSSPSILTNGAIITKNSIEAYVTVTASDSRIKNIIGLSENKDDLNTLKKIEITNYKMKDVATWGQQTFKKVIAQQVETVYPEAIKKQTSVIPDIYALAESVVYDAPNKKLIISLSKDYKIKIGEKIELIHPQKGEILSEVVAVSGNTFTVKDWEYATDKIFVFGREVNDFRSVDYEALSMLGISAIQALAKEVEDLKNQNIQLKLDFNKRLETIEASLKLNPTSSITK